MAPIQPVTVSLHELTLVKTLLTMQATRIRETAPDAIAREKHELVREALPGILDMAARNCTDLAARLSFAVPGEPIEVVQ
jgi:hypothetical protein